MMTITTGATFDLFAAECLQRTGHALKAITVETPTGWGYAGAMYIAVDATNDAPAGESPDYTLYFAQDDEAAYAGEEIDQHGIDRWLSSLYGATEFFIEAQRR